MFVNLYTTQPPRGRCALLAYRLNEVGGPEASIQLAERLFAGHYSFPKPAVVAVVNPDALEGLRAICCEYGISLEIQEST